MIGFMFGVCIVFLGVYMLSPKSQPSGALSLNDGELELSEQGKERKKRQESRGYSWDKDDKNQRMVSVWATSNDAIIAKVLDSDPIAKLEKEASKGAEKAIKRVSTGAERVRKFSSEMGSGSFGGQNQNNTAL